MNTKAWQESQSSSDIFNVAADTRKPDSGQSGEIPSGKPNLNVCRDIIIFFDVVLFCRYLKIYKS